jgi:hypothetical protein
MKANPRSICRTLLVAAAALLSTPVVAVAAIDAYDAGDVCTPSQNPCLVTTTVNVMPNAVLDFGTRTLRLQDGGALDFGDTTGTVLCGDFDADPWGGGVRIQVRKNVGGMVGGSGTIVARGSCSGDASVPCLNDADCDAEQAGICTAASGTMTIDDNVRGDADPAATLTLVAYGDITTGDVINLNNGGPSPGQVGGGTFEVRSETGAVTINGRIDVNGGIDAQGGRVSITAGTDVTVDEWINATGGHGGGGSVSLRAGGDVWINTDVNARSDVGEGVGGEVRVQAGGDITVTGNSATSFTTIDTKGHASDGYSGSGGEQAYDADEDVSIGPYVRLRADAAADDGDGGTLEINACAVSIDTTSILEATGFSGGQIEIRGRGNVTVGASSTVDAGSDPDGAPGEIRVTVRQFGTCSNNPTIHCLANFDCTVGCQTGQCQNVNPNTAGTTSQFDPAPEFAEDPALAPCN